VGEPKPTKPASAMLGRRARPRDRRVSGPYVFVFPREDDYLPGQRLCGFLRKKGLEGEMSITA
jgi:hypothetical protein